MKVVISKPYIYRGKIRSSGISLVDDENSGIYIINNFKTAIVGSLMGMGYKVKNISGNSIELSIEDLETFENILRINNIKYEYSNTK